MREIAATPPTDGKQEESIDFKRMIHGIHAAGIRENPLQIVGFGGLTTYIFDEEEVQYPGNLANCVACHTESGSTLPLPSGVLGTTIDTGIDLQSPIDDTVISPTTAVCSSCHDSDGSRCPHGVPMVAASTPARQRWTTVRWWKPATSAMAPAG